MPLPPRSARPALWARGWVAASVVAALGVPAAAAAAAVDPLLADQWHLATIGVHDAWKVTQGAGVTIAVVDSGVDTDHEDLGARLGGGTACLATGGDPGACAGSVEDDNGHGTHVAGIALATGGNGVGGAGVAPAARLMPVRVLKQVCAPAVDLLTLELCVSAGNTADTGAAIRWAVDHGADIVNLSLGEPIALRVTPGTELGDDVEYAWSKGVIVVGAAGNDFDVAMGSHYRDLPLVVVAATGPDDAKASYSNTVGEVRWGVAAPGGAGPGECPSANILSTLWRATGENDAYGCMAGTSMAAPVVSGGLALLRASGLSAAGAVQRLTTTADDIGPPGVDSQFGFGRINLARALRPAAAPPAPPHAGGSGGGGGPVPSEPVPSPAPGTVSPPSSDGADRVEAPARNALGGAGELAAPGAPPDLDAGVRPSPGVNRTSAVGRGVAVLLAVALLVGDSVLVARARRRVRTGR